MDIDKLYLEWQNDKIPSAKMALAYFFYYHHQKYPSKKLEDLLNENGVSSLILSDYVFKKVKSKAINALQKWIDGEWSFKLLTSIPTPLEVLEFQAAGIRPVTMIIQEQLSPILNKADCFEFFVHDLEHGHMFFHDEQLKMMQIDFFTKMLASYRMNTWNQYLQDGSFKEKFDYLISDMNTHKEHYRHYLYSLLPKNECADFNFLFD